MTSPAISTAQAAKDSMRKNAPSFTLGLHSQGFVPFSGSVLNRHAMFDALFIVPVKPVTFFLYKSLDIQDYRTDLNYITTGFLKTYNLSGSFSLTTAAFYCISQAGSVMDSTSDAGFIIKATYNISKVVSVENTEMFSNLTKSTLQKDFVSRLQISYQSKMLDVSISAWYNTPLWNNTVYVSVSPEVIFKQLAVTKHINMSASLAYFNMPVKNTTCAISNTFIFSFKAPLNL